MSDNPQRTDEWVRARLGKVTASRVADVIAKTKSGWSSSRENYMVELISERRSGQPFATYTNAGMQRGLELEPEARAAYASYIDTAVEEVGFVPHPTIAMAGCSPDGCVRGDGLVEIKCPSSPATHFRTIMGKGDEGKYLPQMQFQLACTGRAWCDFVSYDPREPDCPLWVNRVYRNPGYIADLERQVIAFLAELENELAAFKRLIAGKSDLRDKLEASAATS